MRWTVRDEPTLEERKQVLRQFLGYQPKLQWFCTPERRIQRMIPILIRAGYLALTEYRNGTYINEVMEKAREEFIEGYKKDE